VIIGVTTLRNHRESLCPLSHHGCWSLSGAVFRPPARPAGLRPGPPAGLPPAPDRRPGHPREARPGPAVRLLLAGDRRPRLRRHHDPPAARRVDPDGDLRAAARDRRESYDRIVGLALEELAVDGCITKAPGGGQCAGRSPVDRGKLGMKRSVLVEGNCIPLGRALAPANRNDSVLLAATLDKLDEIGPLPEGITVHLDAGYDSRETRAELASRNMKGSSAATSGTRPSSTRSSTSPTPSSRSVASSARHGPSTDRTPARQDAPNRPPTRATSKEVLKAPTPQPRTLRVHEAIAVSAWPVTVPTKSRTARHAAVSRWRLNALTVFQVRTNNIGNII
jgi:hypothetical protein